MFEKLNASMEKRINACIKNKGGLILDNLYSLKAWVTCTVKSLRSSKP